MVTMERAWTHYELFKKLHPPDDIPFDHDNLAHLAILKEAAVNCEF